MVGGELHREVLDHLPDAVFLYRGEELLYVNAAACRLLGYADRTTLLAARPLQLVEPQDRGAVRDRLVRLRAGLPVEARDVGFRRADGSVVYLEVVSHPIELQDGPAVLSVGRDVAERREAHERRIQADRALSIGTLAAGVAHEINNPLTFVVTNLGYAISELRTIAEAGDPFQVTELVEALAEAQEGAERIRLIVQELRAFSRLEEGVEAPVDVNRVLRSSVNLAAADIRARARLERAFQPVPPVLGSEGRLGQVFLNLLVNATHAIPPGRPQDHEVRVACFPDAHGQVVVEVRDTGAGMPPEVRARVFDPFFTTKPAGVGTGIGLSICQRIVTGLGGDIAVESAPGEGSIFRVRLPPAP